MPEQSLAGSGNVLRNPESFHQRIQRTAIDIYLTLQRFALANGTVVIKALLVGFT